MFIQFCFFLLDGEQWSGTYAAQHENNRTVLYV